MEPPDLESAPSSPTDRDSPPPAVDFVVGHAVAGHVAPSHVVGHVTPGHVVAPGHVVTPSSAPTNSHKHHSSDVIHIPENNVPSNSSSRQSKSCGLKDLLLREEHCECCNHNNEYSCNVYQRRRHHSNPNGCYRCGLVGADCDCAMSSDDSTDSSVDMTLYARQRSLNENLFRGTGDKVWMKRKSDLDVDICGKKPRCDVKKRPRWMQPIPSRANPPPGMLDWLKTFQNWSNSERMLALDELVGFCEPTQVRHLMSVIEPQFQRDFISLLPKELALYVLSFLEPKDLLKAAQTCRYWRQLAEDNLLWREKCREEGVDENLVFGSRARRKALGIGSNAWKFLYLRQYQIEQNWRLGPIKTPKPLKGHDDHVITCLEFSGNRIVSGSDDNTLKVWCAVTGECLRTLSGHTGGVWSSQMVENIVISGSTDRTLRVWDCDTGECLHTLYGHSSTVRCMDLHGRTVVSGSRDATLRMWNYDTGECLHVLVGHVAAVRCVQWNGRKVVSGAYDFMVKIWDPVTENCLHTLQGHTNRVYSLQFDDKYVVSGSLDTSIRVWDVESGNCLHKLVGHQSLTSGMGLKDNILVSGNADSTVKVWNISTGQCLQTLQGSNKHQSAVTCLQFNKKFVITSSDDGTVKLWCLKTGEFLRNLVRLDSGGSGGVVWRVKCCNTRLVCAVGSRNGTEETKLLVLDFDVVDGKADSDHKTIVIDD